MFRFGVFIVVLCSSWFVGCTKMTAPLLTTAPNAISPFAGPSNPLPSLEDLSGVDSHFFVDVGPPQAKLAVSIVNPTINNRPPEATVLILHGIRGRSAWLMPVARVLSEHGYRSVLVDLRGHGRSTGSEVTFGVRESLDLTQVIDHLEKNKLIAGKLGVYGVSLGASTSIQLAANDERIQSVVAVAPFTSLSDVAPDYVAGILPGFGLLVPKGQVQTVVDSGSASAGFQPEATDCISAIQQIKVPVLLIHGTSDRLIPVAHSKRLHDANPDSKLVLVPRYGHIGVQLDPNATVVTHAVEWFDETLLGIVPAPKKTAAAITTPNQPSTQVP